MMAMKMQTMAMMAKISHPPMLTETMTTITTDMLAAAMPSAMIVMRGRKDERRYKRKDNFRLTMTTAMLTTLSMATTTIMMGMQRTIPPHSQQQQQ